MNSMSSTGSAALRSSTGNKTLIDFLKHNSNEVRSEKSSVKFGEAEILHTAKREDIIPSRTLAKNSNAA